VDSWPADTRLAAILDGLVDPFYALDAQWRVCLFNRRAEAHFGLLRGDVLGRSIWDLFPHAVGGDSTGASARSSRAERRRSS
jgi:PAS domain S-box-containing protein